MSGAEAVACVQLIDACIGIAKAIIDIGRAVKNDQGAGDYERPADTVRAEQAGGGRRNARGTRALPLQLVWACLQCASWQTSCSNDSCSQ